MESQLPIRGNPLRTFCKETATQSHKSCKIDHFRMAITERNQWVAVSSRRRAGCG
jgi:hypothetical protein